MNQTLERKVLTRAERCKQCGLCVARCPKQCIAFSRSMNKAGYYFTVIDDGQCIGCGTCYIVCPDGVYEVLG